MERITTLMLLGTALLGGCSEAPGVEIGPRGGIVESADGRFTVEIPKGALQHETDITVDEVECEQAKSLGPCYELGPWGLQLLRPCFVTYALDAETLDGVDIEDLSVLTEHEDGWKPLADRDFDAKDAYVTASAIYLGTYSIVAEIQ
ncbi:MAG: hypothetical protein K0V04_44480 [Deltaproteobacteria bacterium]|nr:hypothetical protein [Deltaproteobacteria bacterium]